MITKYYCYCGKEITRLCAAWKDNTAFRVELLCEDHAKEWREPLSYNNYALISLPIRINTDTKKKAVSQIIAQYLQHGGGIYYLPKTDIGWALSKVTKKKT